jgi:hypothetical protein
MKTLTCLIVVCSIAFVSCARVVPIHEAESDGFDCIDAVNLKSGKAFPFQLLAIDTIKRLAAGTTQDTLNTIPLSEISSFEDGRFLLSLLTAAGVVAGFAVAFSIVHILTFGIRITVR